MEEIKKLFAETRRLRLYYRSFGAKYGIDGAACAIRERALLDALIALGMPKEEVKKLEKI